MSVFYSRIPLQSLAADVAEVGIDFECIRRIAGNIFQAALAWHYNLSNSIASHVICFLLGCGGVLAVCHRARIDSTAQRHMPCTEWPNLGIDWREKWRTSSKIWARLEPVPIDTMPVRVGSCSPGLPQYPVGISPKKLAFKSAPLSIHSSLRSRLP